MSSIIVYKKFSSDDNMKNFLMELFVNLFCGSMIFSITTKFKLEIEENNLIVTAFTISQYNGDLLDYTKVIQIDELLSATYIKQELLIEFKKGEKIDFYNKINKLEVESFVKTLSKKITTN